MLNILLTYRDAIGWFITHNGSMQNCLVSLYTQHRGVVYKIVHILCMQGEYSNYLQCSGSNNVRMHIMGLISLSNYSFRAASNLDDDKDCESAADKWSSSRPASQLVR